MAKNLLNLRNFRDIILKKAKHGGLMKKELKEIVSICHPNGFWGNDHIHAHHEMVYCFEGCGFVHIKGKKMNFSTGNYYITHSGTPHSECDSDACRIIYFFFDAPLDRIREGAYTDYKGNVASIVKQLYEGVFYYQRKSPEKYHKIIKMFLP